MLSSQKPVAISIDILRTSIKQKYSANKIFLLNMIADIEQLYNKLDRINFGVEIFTHREGIPTDEVRALLHLYSSKTMIVEENIELLYKSNRESIGGKCPYCGIVEALTIDHYLPQELFPEYCIHLSNLIPCCTVCQGKKGIKYIENGLPLFIHSYNSIITSNTILECRVIDWKASYYINYGNITSAANRNTIDRQVHLLDIINRCKLASIDRIDEYRRNIEDRIKKIGLSDTIGFVDKEAKYLERQYGSNSWTSALMRGISVHLHGRTQ